MASTINLHGIATLAHDPVVLVPRRFSARRPVHHARGAALAELVDGADGVNGGVERAAGVEVLLHDGEQILAGTGGAGGVLGRGRDPGVGECGVGGHARGGVDGQAALDEVARRERDAAPVLERREGVVGHQDGLHLFQVRVPVEGRVAAQEEVGDDADGPDVAVDSLVWVVMRLKDARRGEWGETYTGFPWPDFLNISGAMYPGVPHVVVKTWKASSSIIRERPKSAIRRSALSSGVRKSKFSGLRSR